MHQDDLTYAVIAGDHNGCFPADILGTYRVISECIVSGLGRLGIRATVATESREDDPERLKASCFSLPSRFELLVGCKKICGSAQTRSRGTFLQHGSLLLSFDPVKTYEVMLPHREPREKHIRLLGQGITSVGDQLPDGGEMFTKLCAALKEAFAEHFQAEFHDGVLTSGEEKLKEALLKNKYRQESWNREGKVCHHDEC